DETTSRASCALAYSGPSTVRASWAELEVRPHVRLLRLSIPKGGFMSSRRASLVLFGILASGAIAHGLVGCTSDDNAPVSPKQDAAVTDHTTPDSSVTGECNGALPVMFVLDESGAKVDPDWSCYVEADAGFLALDDGGDGGEDADADDASDAEVPDAA